MMFPSLDVTFDEMVVERQQQHLLRHIQNLVNCGFNHFDRTLNNVCRSWDRRFRNVLESTRQGM